MVSEDQTRNSVNERTDGTEHAGSGSTPSLHLLLVHHSKSFCGHTAFRSILVSPKEPARVGKPRMLCRVTRIKGSGSCIGDSIRKPRRP